MLKLSTLLMVVLCSSVICFAQTDYDNIIRQRFATIKAGLDTMLFVKRFLSVETPCLCIDEQNNTIAEPKREVVNSDYRIGLSKYNRIDTGVKCLSEHYARYMKFIVENTDSTNIIKGKVAFTYSYPASSIIQYLGMTSTNAGKTNAFFDKLIRSEGTFAFYPEKDKYRIRLSLNEAPFNNKDTILGYLEIVKGTFSGIESYEITFNEMSIYKGDKNTQISLNFSTTSHRYETEYYARLIYDVLKFKNSGKLSDKATAIWLESFFNNPDCPSCNYVYNIATFMLTTLKFSLPNTEPVPSH